MGSFWGGTEAGIWRRLTGLGPRMWTGIKATKTFYIDFGYEYNSVYCSMYY